MDSFNASILFETPPKICILLLKSWSYFIFSLINKYLFLSHKLSHINKKPPEGGLFLLKQSVSRMRKCL